MIRCQTCGGEVKVHGTKEGTHYFEPVDDAHPEVIENKKVHINELVDLKFNLTEKGLHRLRNLHAYPLISEIIEPYDVSFDERAMIFTIRSIQVINCQFINQFINT